MSKCNNTKIFPWLVVTVVLLYKIICWLKNDQSKPLGIEICLAGFSFFFYLLRLLLFFFFIAFFLFFIWFLFLLFFSKQIFIILIFWFNFLTKKKQNKSKQNQHWLIQTSIGCRTPYYHKDSCISRTFLFKFWAKNRGCGLYTRPLLSDRVKLACCHKLNWKPSVNKD